jgi:hypothetical protein
LLNVDSAEKALYQKRAESLYDQDCPRIDWFFSGDIFDGPVHGSLGENLGFFSGISIHGLTPFPATCGRHHPPNSGIGTVPLYRQNQTTT